MAKRTAGQSNDGTGFHDEFENPSSGPIGLHRGKPSAAARTMPYIIVLVVAVLCALLAWGLLSGNLQALFGGNSKPVVTASQVRDEVKKKTSSSTSSTKKKATTTKKEAADSSKSTDSSASSDSQSSNADKSADASSAQSTQQAQVNHGTQVYVFNALPTTVATRDGFAARQAQVLTNAGYTNVQANTLTSGLPSANTVWYRDASDEATARDIASKLGISSVEQQTSLREPVAAIFVSAN
jgi:hypothetical protein